MPVCRFFAKYSECKVRRGGNAKLFSTERRRVSLLQEPDCPFKHSSDDIKVVQRRADVENRSLLTRLRAGLQHVQARLLHTRSKLARGAAATRQVVHSRAACSRFRHLKQAGPAPSPEQAHMIVTRPGRPGSEVLQRGWGS